MLKDVESVLDLADEQLVEIESIYQQTLEAKEVSGRLKALIKNVIENQRSALDFVATAVTEKYGNPGNTDVYWPYSKAPGTFVKRFDKKMPGVRQAQPDIAKKWETHQPYHPGYQWIDDLFELARANKHRTLTPQTKQETRR